MVDNGSMIICVGFYFWICFAFWLDLNFFEFGLGFLIVVDNGSEFWTMVLKKMSFGQLFMVDNGSDCD